MKAKCFCCGAIGGDPGNAIMCSLDYADLLNQHCQDLYGFDLLKVENGEKGLYVVVNSVFGQLSGSRIEAFVRPRTVSDFLDSMEPDDAEKAAQDENLEQLKDLRHGFEIWIMELDFPEPGKAEREAGNGAPLPIEPQFYTTSDLRRILIKSPNTVLTWCQEKTPPCHNAQKDPSDQWRIPAKDVNEFLGI